MVTRRPPFPGALLTIQWPPDWSASQSPLGALLKSTSLSLPDVFRSAPPVHLALPKLIDALLAA